MIKEASVRNRLIMGVIAACILPFLIGGWYIQRIVTEQEAQNFKANSCEVLNNIHDRINDRLIKPANRITSFLATDYKILELANILDNRQVISPRAIEPVLYSHLTNYKSLFPNVMVGLATEQGDYFEIPAFVRDQGYGPKKQLWYQKALEHKGQVYLSDPYIMQATGEMVIPIVHTLENKGDTTGAIVTSWNITDFQKEIEEATLGVSDCIAVINQNNKVIISSKHPEWLMKTPQEIGFPDLTKLSDGQLHEVDINSKSQFVLACTSAVSGWKAIAVIEKDLLQKKVYKVLGPIVIACSITVMVILISIFLIAQVYVIRPIRALTEGAVAIAGGDLDASVAIKRQDEIGILAATFNEMASKLKLNFSKIRLQNELLFKRENELQTLVENAQDIILRTDKHRIITYLNPVFGLYCTVPVKKLIGQHLSATMLPECFVQAVNEVFSKKETLLMEFEFLTTGGETVNFQAQLIPEFNIKDDPETVLAVIRNVTSQKQIEKQLVRMDGLHIIGEMAASIAHEVRNPMTTIRGFLQLILQKEVDSPYIPFYTLMIEELDRANSIITEFLSLAKNKSVNLRLFNLNKIIRVITPLIEAGANISNKFVSLDLQEIPEVLLNDQEIRQLILNLVRNGFEAMPEAGTVTIRTYCEAESVVLAIKDQGEGMNPKILENIGMPFQTTKEKGTGLGLAVCYSIVTRHKAKLDIQTGPGGTEFFIHFPYAADDHENAE